MEINITKSGNIVYVTKDGDVTVNVTRYSPVRYQSALLFEDEGVPLGTTGDVTELNFVGSAVTATRSGNRVTVSVTGGSSGSGDVVGPASAVADNIAVFDGVTGKLIKDGGTSIASIATSIATFAAQLDNYVILSGDVSNSEAVANTLTDVTGLLFPVTNGQSYHFFALLLYDSANAGNGMRISVNGPAITRMTYRTIVPTAAGASTTSTAGAYQLPGASVATSPATTNNICTIEGTITPSASGNVQIQFASEGSGVAITAKASVSFLKWRRTA